MNAVADDLRLLQRAFAAQLLGAASTIASRVADDGRSTVERRLRVYEDAYRLRLIEVLGADFPALRARIGTSAFDAQAALYLAAHPSTRPSVRDFGRHFSAWLKASGAEAEWVDMAAFEWAQGEVFDAPDADVATLGDVAGVAPQAWPQLRLRVQPAARLLSLAGNTPAQLAAHADGEAWPSWTRADAPTYWLLWRRGFDIHWRSLPDDEAAALKAASAGDDFSGLCVALLQWQPEAEVALRAASLLKRWISDELIAAIEAPD